MSRGFRCEVDERATGEIHPPRLNAWEGRFHPFRPDFTWEGVELRRYKDEKGNWLGVIRQVLAGKSGEEVPFEVRYFEVAPGGYSSLEKHGHPHVVLCLRGKGKAVVGTEVYEMQPYDLVYVGPWTPHQFLAGEEEPFGFLCIVAADRDRPQALSPEELALLRQNPRTAHLIRP